MGKFFFLNLSTSLFFFAIISNAAYATTIVIVVTPHSVILGADSRGSFMNYATLKEQKKDVVKIYQSNEYYFAISGLTNNPNTSFDASRIINTYLKSEKNILLAMDSIKLELSSLLKKELQEQKRNKKEVFLWTMQSSDIVLSFGIIGIKDSKPFAQLVGFQVKDTSTLNINILDDNCPGNCPNGVKVFWIGQAGAISKYIQRADNNEISTLALVEKLINLEIEEKPEFVGPPIDILELTIDKKIWHKRKAGCPIVLN